MQRLAVLAIILGAAPALAHADVPVPAAPPSVELRDQVVADVGLSVIQVGYEHAFAAHVSVAATAGIFGTYFLPWFDLGDNVIGVGGGVRATYFARATGRGPYAALYVRAHRTGGDHDGVHETGFGFTTGAFGGWAFGLTDRLDLRLGAGAQYMYQPHTSTPFIALDVLLGFRL